jgi:glutaredoxin 3
MRAVTIYTTDYCGYCARAKQLLSQLSVPFTEFDVTNDPDKRRWLVEQTGRRTVPQIFFGDEGIGGFTDLDALVKRGELDAALNRAPPH